jgi:hypothetical protein
MVSSNVSIETNKKQLTILSEAVEFLKERFSSSAFSLYALKSDGFISSSPGALRGNKIYAYRQQPRIDSIGQQLESKLKTEYSLETGKLRTNEIFCTFTHAYDYSLEGLEKSWCDVRNHWTKVVRVMKRNGLVDYIRTAEAHLKGGCHLHCVMVLDTLYDFTPQEIVNENKDGSRRIIYRSKSLESMLQEFWGSDFGFIDVQGVDCGEASKYCTKELGKFSECETAIRFYDKGTSSDDDNKRIMTYYMATKLGARLLTCSRGIKFVPVEEDTEEDELCSTIESYEKLKENRHLAMELLDPKNRFGLVEKNMNNTTQEESETKKLVSFKVLKREYDNIFCNFKPDGFCKRLLPGSYEWNIIADLLYEVVSDELFVSRQFIDQVKGKDEITRNQALWSLYRVYCLTPGDGWQLLGVFETKEVAREFVKNNGHKNMALKIETKENTYVE